MELTWVKCQGDVWCGLNSVSLDHEHFNGMQGVYLIWHAGGEPRVVYVGQGEIRERVTVHRKDQEIQQYNHLGLYVTWAPLAKKFRDGVERYLADLWRPKEGSRHPDVGPIRVNSPWD